MAKTNAQKDSEYIERKKIAGKKQKKKQKEKKRQKKYYTKTIQLTKKQLKEQRLAVKERVHKSLERTKVILESMNERCNSCDTDGTVSPLIVSINFPKRGQSSRKRKQRSNDKLYQEIAKLKHDKRRLELKCDSLMKKVHRSMSASL